MSVFNNMYQREECSGHGLRQWLILKMHSCLVFGVFAPITFVVGLDMK